MYIIKEPGTEKDTVEVLDSRRQLYFGHVTRMNNGKLYSPQMVVTSNNTNTQLKILN